MYCVLFCVVVLAPPPVFILLLHRCAHLVPFIKSPHLFQISNQPFPFKESFVCEQGLVAFGLSCGRALIGCFWVELWQSSDWLLWGWAVAELWLAALGLSCGRALIGCFWVELWQSSDWLLWGWAVAELWLAAFGLSCGWALAELWLFCLFVCWFIDLLLVLTHLLNCVIWVVSRLLLFCLCLC